MKIPVGGVAFFDSGVGGLTVLNSCQKYFTNESFYYYGDNERAPYGNLPPSLIRRYVHESFDTFEKLRAKAVVLACNTATALCVDELRARYPFPIIGAEPAIVSAAKSGGEIFVLTTRATFNSVRFRELCECACKAYPQAHLTLCSCDGLAGGIEERFSDPFYDFTRFLPRGSPDAVVLGCTHYLYIKKTIENFYGCKVFDGNDGIARRLCNELRVENASRDRQNQRDWIEYKEKNRDGRPLFQKEVNSFGIFDHFLPGNNQTKKVKAKTNECSRLKISKSLIIRRFPQKNAIFFLGSGARKNKQFYERMFVF